MSTRERPAGEREGFTAHSFFPRVHGKISPPSGKSLDVFSPPQRSVQSWSWPFLLTWATWRTSWHRVCLLGSGAGRAFSPPQTVPLSPPLSTTQSEDSSRPGREPGFAQLLSREHSTPDPESTHSFQAHVQPSPRQTMCWAIK